MKIVLIRHGRPNTASSGFINANDFANLVSDYNNSDIDITNKPPKEVRNFASDCSFTICSQLPRSIQSAKVLNKAINENLAHFNEYEMPYSTGHFIKMPLTMWLIHYRISQLLGHSPNAESFTTFKDRIKFSSSYLINKAKEYDSVVYIGHGLMNWGISKTLLKQGWTLTNIPKRGFWSVSVYSLNG